MEREILKQFFTYVKGYALQWESGIDTTTEATRLYGQRVSAFTARLVGSVEEPHLLFISSEDENDRLYTSTLTDVKVYPNGYALVCTRNTKFHLWNKEYGKQYQAKEAERIARETAERKAIGAACVDIKTNGEYRGYRYYTTTIYSFEKPITKNQFLQFCKERSIRTEAEPAQGPYCPEELRIHETDEKGEWDRRAFLEGECKYWSIEYTPEYTD